ncbi:MAG: TlpA family protein disulfide reductase [Clostridiales bacterium]|nr:TlpA family protein disulfide reductase [Clostridiales bacterium]
MCPLFVLDRYNAEEGAKFSVLESRGKVTVINYWYTDCDPCKGELPEFEEVYKEYNGGINMVAVHSATAASPDEVRAFLDTESDGKGTRWGDYTLWWAQDATGLNTYKMLGGRGVWPVTVVLNKDGVITRLFTGGTSGAALRSAIEEASQSAD